MAFREAITYYDRGRETTALGRIGKILRHRYQKYAFAVESEVLDDRQLYQYRLWRNQLGISTPADPRELRYVDPNAVHRDTAFLAYSDLCWRKIGTVKGGKWDLDRDLLSERFDDIYGALEARYVEGRAWEDIPFVLAVRNGERVWHQYSGEDVWRWCDELDELHESIRTDGYRSMREVLGMSFEEACASDVVTVIDWMDDVRIDIGRDGRLLRHDGKHRLWFARHLDIDRIPVCVVVRHEKWQQVREEIADAESVDGLSERARTHLDHPDMVDVRRSFSSSTDTGIECCT